MGASLLVPHHHVADEGQGLISLTHVLRASSFAPLSIGSNLLCCSSKVQDPFFPSAAVGETGKVGRASLPCPHHHKANEKDVANYAILTRGSTVLTEHRTEPAVPSAAASKRSSSEDQ